MRLDDVIVLWTAVSLFLILGMNIVFPPFVELTTHEAEVSRWTAAYGVLDENSTTFYEFEFVPPPGEYDIETRNTLPFRPPGWFNLTVRIPFELEKNWTRINVYTIFSACTSGGVWFFWTVEWRLYNSSNVAISDDWSDSYAVSANTPITVDKNIEYDIGRDEKTAQFIHQGNGIMRLHSPFIMQHWSLRVNITFTTICSSKFFKKNRQQNLKLYLRDPSIQLSQLE